MSDFKTRLEDESRELSLKTETLLKFIGTEPYLAIDNGQKALLKVQLKAMQTYGACLGERLKML